MKPIFQQKGSSDYPDNYRGITILNCFGKLSKSVINNRLVEYFDENSTTGSEQGLCFYYNNKFNVAQKCL